jgi:hypothetical protein
MWVPGHTGVEGNEEADQLANKGSETHFTGPEPFFGYSSMKYKTDLNEWIEQRKMEHFSDLPVIHSLSVFGPTQIKERNKFLI